MEMTITKLQEDRWRIRGQELRDSRYANDYKWAELASEIRDVLPKGVAGDTQFLQFVRRVLKPWLPCRSDTFLAKAVAFKKFDASDWDRLGGWYSIVFLIGLTAAQRRHLLSVIGNRKGPFNHTKLRQIARKLGIVTQRIGGRDTTERAEYKNQILRAHMALLYKLHPGILGAPPPEVAAAMTLRGIASAKVGAVAHSARA